MNLFVEDTTHTVVEKQVYLVVNVEGYEFLWCFFLVPFLSYEIVFFCMDWLSTMKVDIFCADKSIQSY